MIGTLATKEIMILQCGVPTLETKKDMCLLIVNDTTLKPIALKLITMVDLNPHFNQQTTQITVSTYLESQKATSTATKVKKEKNSSETKSAATYVHGKRQEKLIALITKKVQNPNLQRNQSQFILITKVSIVNKRNRSHIEENTNGSTPTIATLPPSVGELFLPIT